MVDWSEVTSSETGLQIPSAFSVDFGSLEIGRVARDSVLCINAALKDSK
jgi:hypothetical protein